MQPDTNQPASPLPVPPALAAVPEWNGTRQDLDRYLEAHQAATERLDEESLILGLGWSASVCQTHEIANSWTGATADRWYRALPERFMTPDDLRYPDWNHSHYLHDADGHMVHPVNTKQRPETEEDRQAAAAVRAALALADARKGLDPG